VCGLAALALALLTAGCSSLSKPGPPVPEWGFGLTTSETLFEFRRSQAEHAPSWCRHPDTLIEELERTIKRGGSGVGRGCDAQVKDSFAAGRALEITCPLRKVTATCVDTYQAMVWGNRYDDAPANYALYGFAWVRRACQSAAGDFTASPEVEDVAGQSSGALGDFLDLCRVKQP
jgi:hypothetical protein